MPMKCLRRNDDAMKTEAGIKEIIYLQPLFHFAEKKLNR